MLSTGLRVFQLLLVGAAGYLAWATVSSLVSATPMTELELRALAPSAQPDRSFPRYAVIAERDLFKTRGAALAAQPVVQEEELENSEARARLLATLAASDTSQSLAVVEELASREVSVKRLGDQVAGLDIVRIERRRLVVRNGDQLEQISLDDSVPSNTTAASADRVRQAQLAARRAAARSRARARARAARPSTNPAVQLAPNPQSLDLGALLSNNPDALRPGERVSAVNGATLDGSAVESLMEVLSEPGTKVITVVDGDGNEREITLELP